MSKRWKLAVAVAAGLAAATGAGLLLSRPGKARRVKLAPGVLRERILARAVVVPVGGTSHVRARISGIVTAVHVKEGDAVEEGMVLAEIANETVTAEVSRREHELGEARALAEIVREGLRPEERSAVEAQRRAARQDLAIARSRFEVQRRLVAGGATSRQAFTEAEITLRAAQARLEEADARSRAARAGGRRRDRDAALQRVSTAEAALRLAREELAMSVLKSPRAGVVVARYVDPGDTIALSPGFEPVAFEISDPGKLEIRAEVEEIDAPQAAPGLSVTLRAPGGTTPVAAGHVTRVAPQLSARSIGATDARLRADAVVRAVWCKVDEGSDSSPLLIGQRFDVAIDLAPVKVAGLLPRDAVQIRDGRAEVEIASPLGSSRVAVELGRADDERVEVTGLPSGTTVLLPR